jgi:hypothetical protein
MEPSKKDFHTIEYRDLARDLTPDPTNRLLAKDISRRTSLPIKITEGARLRDNVELTFTASAGAGLVSTEIDLNFNTTPLVLVWYLGAKDKAGTVFQGGKLISDETNIALSAVARYSVTPDTLTISITSVNVGWGSPIIDAYFYYAVYYDETNVAEFGL